MTHSLAEFLIASPLGFPVEVARHLEG